MERTRDPAMHSGHRSRMRQRVQSKGFEGLEPHEIIEYLLFYVIPRRDVNELAHRLIERFGSVSGVLNAEIPDLTSIPGVGPRTARWLALVGEAAAACGGLRIEDRPLLKNCLDALRYASRANESFPSPCCVQLCLDVTGRLLFRRTICDSLSWGEPATLREALSDMLVSQARYSILLIFAGAREIEPQEYDAAHAALYADTLRAADCQLVDVILEGNGKLESLNRLRLIPYGEETEYARAVREDYLRNMPEGTLLVRDFQLGD